MSEKLKISINKREMKKEIKNIEESEYFYSLKTQIKKIKSGALEKVFHGEEDRYEMILNNELIYSDDLVSGLFSERFRFDKYQSIIGTIITGEISKPRKIEAKIKPKIEKPVSEAPKPIPKKVVSKFGAKRNIIKTTDTPSIQKEPVKVASKSDDMEKTKDIIEEAVKVEPKLKEVTTKPEVKEAKPKKKAKTKKKTKAKKRVSKKKIKKIAKKKKEDIKIELGAVGIKEQMIAPEEKTVKVKKVKKTKRKKTTKKKKTKNKKTTTTKKE